MSDANSLVQATGGEGEGERGGAVGGSGIEGGSGGEGGSCGGDGSRQKPHALHLHRAQLLVESLMHQL